VEVGSVGAAFTREDVIAALAQESPTQWSIENLKARLLGGGVVLVTYRASRMRRTARRLIAQLHLEARYRAMENGVASGHLGQGLRSAF